MELLLRSKRPFLRSPFAPVFVVTFDHEETTKNAETNESLPVTSNSLGFAVVWCVRVPRSPWFLVSFDIVLVFLTYMQTQGCLQRCCYYSFRNL